MGRCTVTPVLDKGQVKLIVNATDLNLEEAAAQDDKEFKKKVTSSRLLSFWFWPETQTSLRLEISFLVVRLPP